MYVSSYGYGFEGDYWIIEEGRTLTLTFDLDVDF